MLPKSPASADLGRAIREGQWDGRRIRYFAGRVIVKFKPPPPDTDENAVSMSDDVARELPGGRVKRYPRLTGRAVLGFDPTEDVFEVAARLSNRPDVAYAEPDVVDTAQQLVPNDTRYGEQWSHGVIGSEQAWALQTGTASVLIGIIDSGISTTGAGALDHPDLDTAGRFTLGTDFVDGGAPRDLNGHGTHVAGIAAAESNNAEGVAGMNWASPVYICRTLDTFGNGSSADFADAVEEIVDQAVAGNLHCVINYSGGGAHNLTKQAACQYAQNRGVLLCAATGNDNAGPVIFPAAYSATIDNVIAVGSTDANDTVSSFSNVGPEVTVVAPGRGILSTVPTYAVNLPVALNYDYLDGTSMATPLVTGLVALMWSRHPSFTYTAIRNCLINTAVKLGPGAFDNAWGNGRVAAEAALRCGDLIFPTHFTIFTRFTRFTLYTHFTRFTRFTWFTRFTAFTAFTRFTRFTVFTLLTRFTRFTRFSVFTRFPPRFRRPGGEERFVRVGKTVFELGEIEIRRFAELAAAERDLRRVGIRHLHELAASDHQKLAASLRYRPEDAERLIRRSKQLLDGMTRS
jgi:hypothetical protein